MHKKKRISWKRNMRQFTVHSTRIRLWHLHVSCILLELQRIHVMCWLHRIDCFEYLFSVLHLLWENFIRSNATNQAEREKKTQRKIIPIKYSMSYSLSRSVSARSWNIFVLVACSRWKGSTTANYRFDGFLFNSLKWNFNGGGGDDDGNSNTRSLNWKWETSGKRHDNQ